jgi:hypothetical protein
MPAKDGKCIVIIRVEDGRLFKLERAFKDIFSRHCAPHGKLPLGSIVLVGSLSHLAHYGLESYAFDLIKTLSAVGGLVGGDVGIVHYVPVPLGGIEDGATLRALFDLDSWIRGTCLNPGAQLGGRARLSGKSCRVLGRVVNMLTIVGVSTTSPAAWQTQGKKSSSRLQSVPPYRSDWVPWGKGKKKNWLGQSLSRWFCTMGLGWM